MEIVTHKQTVSGCALAMSSLANDHQGQIAPCVFVAVNLKGLLKKKNVFIDMCALLKNNFDGWFTGMPNRFISWKEIHKS